MAEIKNLKKAAERIQRAVKNKEKIVLYGDSDMDGVGSVIILREAIKNLGGDISAVYFPDRETEGYGINEDALSYLKDKVPARLDSLASLSRERSGPSSARRALLIVLDCGIGNFKEIKLAKKIGFEVMVVDHHQVLNKLPEASIIVNPKQKGDRYPFKEFAAAGVTFKLIELLLGNKLTPSLRNNLLELTALATIADMMPQEEDNLEFLEKGLASLKKTFRPGLKVFWQIDSIRDFAKDNTRQFAQKIISACHAGGSQDHLNEGYLLLTSISLKKAKSLAEGLLEKAYSRHLRIKEITEEIEKRILKKPEELIVFEGDESWEILMLGPAASKICKSHGKPIFLYGHRKEDSQGAVRTPSEINGVKAMVYCSKLLETYGGHPQAAGFRIQNKNLEKFKECLVKYFESFNK